MALTDQQFKELMEAVMRSQEEHDLLVKMQASLETSQKLFQNALSQQEKELSDTATKASAAHRRIDSVIIIGGITVFLTVGGMILAVVAFAVQMAS